MPEATPDDLRALDEALGAAQDDPHLVAVGEIGLDFFVPEVQTSPLREKQTECFMAQLRLARRHGLPVILHVRRSVDAVLKDVGMQPAEAPAEFNAAVDRIARSGGTPLAVSENGRLLGVVYLKDIIKPGIRERFQTLRKMGIRTVMVTGDNPLTATAIATQAGVDDFIAGSDSCRNLRCRERDSRWH